MMGLGLRGWGLDLGVWGLRSGVWSAGFRVQRSELGWHIPQVLQEAQCRDPRTHLASLDFGDLSELPEHLQRTAGLGCRSTHVLPWRTSTALWGLQLAVGAVSVCTLVIMASVGGGASRRNDIPGGARSGSRHISDRALRARRRRVPRGHVGTCAETLLVESPSPKRAGKGGGQNTAGARLGRGSDR